MMEGKLIKLGLSEGYRLDDLNGNYIASTLNGKNKLSLKNCEEIELGYDLIKLIEENSKYSEEDWGDGFLFAMNLMSDKKFTKEDMGRIMVYGYDKSTENEYLSRIPFDEYIQSLQQTQWDVEIEMICPHPSDTYRCGMEYGCDADGCNHPNKVPYLDSDGCLILRRI